MFILLDPVFLSANSKAINHEDTKGREGTIKR